jgi:hypothetical protein
VKKNQFSLFSASNNSFSRFLMATLDELNSEKDNKKYKKDLLKFMDEMKHIENKDVFEEENFDNFWNKFSD